MVLISSNANQLSVIESTPLFGANYVEVFEGQFIGLNKAIAVPQKDLQPIEIENNTISDGLYLVGFDIPSGQYLITQKEDSKYPTYIIYSSLDKNNSSIYGNLIENSTYIDVADGQYLYIIGAEITSDLFDNR